MTKETLLREREKELACIYSICLLAAGAPEPRAAAEGIARALCAAMRYESKAGCRVRFEGLDGGDPVIAERGRLSSSGNRPALESRLPQDKAPGWRGSIRVEYRDPELTFLPQEQALLDSVLVVSASMLRTASLIARLRAATEDLTAKNIALREILSMIEQEKRDLQLAFREREIAIQVRNGRTSKEIAGLV